MLIKLLNKKLVEYAGFDTARVSVLNDGFVTVEVPYTELAQAFSADAAATYCKNPDGWVTLRFFDTYTEFEDWLCGDE